MEVCKILSNGRGQIQNNRRGWSEEWRKNSMTVM